MKVIIMQPPYPACPADAEKTILWQINQLRQINPGEADLVLLPENANCAGPADVDGKLALIDGAGAEYVAELSRTAVRLQCPVMSGLTNIGADGIMRNQLTVFTPDGDRFSPYTKIHLTEPELAIGIEPGKTPMAFEYNGIKYGAAICFDFYFPEMFVEYAKQEIDLMLVASHQRQERPDILETVSAARAFDCGCTLLRSAPAMPNANIGGRSLIASPEGKLLANAGGTPGVIRFEVDPKARFIRSASFSEPDRVSDYRQTLMCSRKNLES